MPKTTKPDKRHRLHAGRVRSLGEILTSNQSRNDAQLAVAQGAEGLEESRAWVCSFLPAELVAHVLHALERNGELVVFTESGAWASRLAMTLAEHRASLAPRLALDARVSVRVVPGGRYRR